MIKKHLKVYINHSILNIGGAIQCIYHAIMPPQFDHDKESVDSLSKDTFVNCFLEGIGYNEQKSRRNK